MTLTFVLPHEHFVYSEFKAGDQRESLKITFVAHEVVLEGFLLRRIENAMVNRDLSWLCVREEKFRPQNHERPFVTKLIVRALETTASASEKSCTAAPGSRRSCDGKAGRSTPSGWCG
jgi:hypothetical protein